MRRLPFTGDIDLEIGKHYFSINSGYHEFYFKVISVLEVSEEYRSYEVYIYYAITEKYSMEKDPMYAGGISTNKLQRACRHVVFELTDDEIRDLILLETI